MCLSRQTNGVNFLKEKGSNIAAYCEGMVIKMAESILIKDTTREQRIQIIKRSLNICGEICEGCTLCDGLTGLGDPWDMYRPYIDGKKEISEINAEFRAGFMVV